MPVSPRGVVAATVGDRKPRRKPDCPFHLLHPQLRVQHAWSLRDSMCETVSIIALKRVHVKHRNLPRRCPRVV